MIEPVNLNAIHSRGNQHRQFCQFTIAQQDNIPPAIGGAKLKKRLILLPPEAKNIEGNAEIGGGQPGFLSEAFRCEIIEVTPHRRLAELHQPFLDAALEVPIDRAHGHAKPVRQLALGNFWIAFYLGKQLPHNLIVGHFASRLAQKRHCIQSLNNVNQP